MNVWNKLDPAQQDFLTALPYRTGLWLSQCDETGGVESAQRELAALETIVISYAEDFCKSEFVEMLMRRTLARRAEWGQWQDDIDNLPAAATEALDLLVPLLDRKDISSFKHTLIEIATTVAEAYREEDEENEQPGDLFGDIRDHIVAALERLTGRYTDRPEPVIGRFSNISQAERVALAALAEALRLGEVEGLPPVTDEG